MIGYEICAGINERGVVEMRIDPIIVHFFDDYY